MRKGFSPGTIIHPRAKIDARAGSIQLGDNCIVEEMAVLRSTDAGMIIGNGNLFSAKCHVQAATIGNGNLFQPRCDVAANVHVSDFCTIGAACHVGGAALPPDTLPDRTVVYGQENERRIWSGEGIGQQLAQHTKHLLYLRDTLPHAHKLRLIP